ncbi:hypothetical protein ACQKP0_15020 [Heyndrickxia sp. NPDC080065]
MNSLNNQVAHATIRQLFNNLSPNDSGCAYIASFDDCVTTRYQ